MTADDDSEEELISNGVWGAIITILSFAYGQHTIASVLAKDPRQDKWVMMKSPVPTLVMCLIYVAAVTWVGPRMMRGRPPLRGIKSVMMAYNTFQVFFNAYIVYEAGVSGWFGQYKMLCEPCDFTQESRAIRMMNISYWYWFSKLLDFADTLFFVLNQKYSHISLLHVSHHALMPISMWYGVAYHPGGHNTFAGFLNSFVHVVMYSYYLLAALGPRVRPYLWWKKYLTSLQMIQFVAIWAHSFLGSLVPNCKVPYAFLRWVGVMAIVFLILFTDFYIKAYKKRDGAKKNLMGWVLQQTVCLQVNQQSSTEKAHEANSRASDPAPVASSACLEGGATALPPQDDMGPYMHYDQSVRRRVK